MKPELWKKIDELFAAAQAQPRDQRAAFLDRACEGDQELRAELESLLSAATSDKSFLDHPAAPTSDWPALKPGDKLGAFEVAERIGRGGMGEVYKAIDRRLNRTVALKFSASRFSDRFEREARAIAALNHPHVCTLYDIGPNYLVMEYVEGTTLRQISQERRLPVEEAILYATQIAGAIEAAHAAGIIHRDLKPGNVMVNAVGQVKVLDFGLAKMIQPLISGSVSSLDTTVTNAGAPTRAGVILGSPAYMSPEQALGKPLDARCDIFSFGVLLYEMLTGQQAFAGDSTLEVVSGILRLDLPPPSAANPEVGGALDALVARSMRKDPAQRFQSMEEVRRELEGIAGTPPAIPQKPKPPQVQKWSWVRWAALAAGLLILTAAAFLLWRKWPAAPADSGEAPEMTRVTTDGSLSITPAISPDGKLVAYASDRSGDKNLDIFVKQIGGGDPIRLTNDPADDFEPDFSPDGTHVVFRSDRDGGGIYIVPTMGGEQRRIADGGRRPQYSPDGSKVLYWTGPADPFPLSEGTGKIFVLDLETSTTRRIRPDFVAAVHPIWSPDGNKILFVGAKSPPAGKFDWWITGPDDRPAIACPVTPLGHLFDPFVWRGDQVYFAWQGEDLQTIARLTVNPQTGRVSGKPRRLSAVTSDAFYPAVSRTGQILFSVLDRAVNLYSLPLDANAGKSKDPIVPLSQGRNWNVVESISADAMRLAFISVQAKGIPQLWTKDLPSGRERALTEGGRPKYMPEISSDGLFVAWSEALPRSRDLIVPFNGGTPREMCSECGLIRAWSPDGKFLLYDQPGAHYSIGLMEFASGKTSTYLQSKDSDLFARSISADGKWIAFTAHGTAVDFTVYVAAFAPERAPSQPEWVEVTSSSEVDPKPCWSADGSLLYFTSERDGHSCVWGLRLNRLTKKPSGKLFPVQHFHAPRLSVASTFRYPAMAVARDRMILSLREQSGDIWMLQLPGSK